MPRRAAILYAAHDFRRRHCHNLAYSIGNETVLERMSRRVDRICEQLAWDPGVLNAKSWKTKGMQWPTYRRLVAEPGRYAESDLRSTSRLITCCMESTFSI